MNFGNFFPGTFCEAFGRLGPNEKMAQIDILRIAKDSLDDNSDTRLLFSCVVYTQWLEIKLKKSPFATLILIWKWRKKKFARSAFGLPRSALEEETFQLIF